MILRIHLRKGGNTDRNSKENIFLSSGMYINFLPAYMRGKKKNKTKQNKTNKETKKTNS